MESKLSEPVVPQANTAFFGQLNLPFTRFSQSCDLLLWCGRIREKRLNESYWLIQWKNNEISAHFRKFDALRLHRADRLRPPMQKSFRHGRFVDTLHSSYIKIKQSRQGNNKDIRTRTVQSKIRRLKSHLHVRIGAKSMTRNKILPVPLELQCLAIILTDQITQSGLSKPNPDPQFRCELPFELLWRGIVRFMIGVSGGPRRCEFITTNGLVGLGIWREGSVEQRRGGRVDGPREEHEAFCIYVCGEPTSHISGSPLSKK